MSCSLLPGEINWMSARATAFAAAVALGLSAVAMAKEGTSTPNPAVTALLADIEAGRGPQALSRISRTPTVTDRNNAVVKSSAEFVDLLSACKLASRTVSESSRRSPEMTEWQCADGIYQVQFTPEMGGNNPYVRVTEILDPPKIAEATTAARPSVSVVLAPATPRKTLPEAERTAQEERIANFAKMGDAFGRAVAAGNLQEAAAYITPSTRFSFGSHDPLFNTDVVETQGVGLSEGNHQIASAIAALGEITAVECVQRGNWANICHWNFGNSDHALSATLFMLDDQITAVDFSYSTPEKLIEFRKAAQERGAIDG